MGHIFYGTFRPGDESSKGCIIKGRNVLNKFSGTRWSGSHRHGIDHSIIKSSLADLLISYYMGGGGGQV